MVSLNHCSVDGIPQLIGSKPEIAQLLIGVQRVMDESCRPVLTMSDRLTMPLVQHFSGLEVREKIAGARIESFPAPMQVPDACV